MEILAEIIAALIMWPIESWRERRDYKRERGTPLRRKRTEDDR